MPDLERHAREWRPDLVVRESTEFAGCILAEKVGLPHASVATGSRSARLDDRLRFAPSLPELRARHGLTPDPDLAMHVRYLAMSLVPPAWDGDVELPDTLHHFRYEPPSSLDGVSMAPPESGRPLVLAALGTLFHRAPGLFEAIIEAAGDLDVQLIAAVGRDVDDARFASVPPNVRVVMWVPQVELLGHAAAFVTHGGFNSTKEALSRGVPMVVLPLGADQFYTAERVRALGLGIEVGTDERDPATLRARIREVLEEPAYRERAAAFAAAMAVLPALSEGVGLLERLVRDQRPIRRAGLD
jgi:MGT family glycosyltransferase